MHIIFVSILSESLKKPKDFQFSFEDVPTVLNITNITIHEMDGWLPNM